MSQFDRPHRRKNPLTGEWILVSPHRAKRPWQGGEESIVKEQKPEHDENCYLCPNNARVSGQKNPNYEHTFVFDNDHRALLPDTEDMPTATNPLCEAEAVQGTARVMCFSPRHDLTFAEMDIDGIENVIQMWRDQLNDLGSQYEWVQLFENKGAAMGCSSPHPHGQVWAGNFLPNEIRKEDDNQRAYFEKHNSPLLLDYVEFELKAQERIVVENNDWVVLVPFWATWPFETLVLPRAHIQRLTDLSEEQQTNLAQALKRILMIYDDLFNVSFPYSMGWHGAPFNQQNNQHWQVHAHFYPPLLRSATVKKFMVGYELLAEAQRDLTPEQAAERLRGCHHAR